MRIHTVEELETIGASLQAPGYRWSGGMAGAVQWFKGVRN
jgi:hypothetical protein